MPLCYRCHLPSGKVVWLCPDHQKGERVTVLGSGEIMGEGDMADDDNVFASEIAQATQGERPRKFYTFLVGKL